MDFLHPSQSIACVSMEDIRGHRICEEVSILVRIPKFLLPYMAVPLIRSNQSNPSFLRIDQGRGGVEGGSI